MKKNEFIKQIRQKYKMSQKKFAEYLEVSKSLIEKVEMGRSEATPENKYVKAVCALEGLDNEIFSYDEITDEVLQKHELSKFSKAFRKFLYFYYGDFWNEDFLKKFIFTYKDFLGSNLTFYLMENEPFLMNSKNFDEDLFNYYLTNFSKQIDIKEILLNLIKDNQEIKYELRLFLEIFIILTINNLYNRINFKPSNFNDLNLYLNFLKNENAKKILKKYDFFYFEAIEYNFDTISNILKRQENEGISLNIENIKVLRDILQPSKIKNIVSKIKNKKQKELETIQEEVIPAPTDPKDKQICELLQYAPTAFKDKIIEKLLQYKKDVEEF